jgi:putative NIF3 family GTP cyclohydrolase 1 type 2
MDSRGRAGLDAVLIGDAVLTGEGEKNMSNLSRRQFALMAGAGLAAANLAQAQKGKLTAGEVVDRVKKNIGAPWPDNDPTFRDWYKIGGPDQTVTGIATSFGGNLRVLQIAQKAGLNMIIVHEPTFWSDADIRHPGTTGGQTECGAACQADPLFKLKMDWATKNNIVVWRIHDHIHARKPADGIRLGFARTIGWEKYQLKPDDLGHWKLPPTTLGEVAKYVAKTLETKSVRVVGDPNLPVTTVAYGGHGLAQNMDAIQAADCAIVSEAREYDSFEYARDAVLSGAKKGAIFISHESGEDAGMGWFADWLRPLVPEVPVKLVSTTDEFWTV